MLRQRAPGHEVVPVSLCQFRECGHLAVEIDENQGMRGLGAEDERSVEHVLAGEPAVQPAGGVLVASGEPFAHQRHERYDRVATRLGLRGNPGEVLLADQPSQCLVVDVRRDARSFECVEPDVLHRDHRLEKEALVERHLGPFITGPEEVGHHAPGNCRKTVSPVPWSRTSKRKPPSSGVATRVRRRSSGTDFSSASESSAGSSTGR